MNPNDNENTTRLKIFGEEFTVKSKADDAYLQDVARYVDQHMREISQNMPVSQPSLRIAVLAAMNISDELFSLRKQYDEVNSTVQTKTSELSQVIQEALGQHTVE